MLASFRGNNARLAQAARWLDANRQQFQRTVYGPLMLDVRLESEQHVRYFEAVVGWRIRSGFLVQSEDDQKRLVREFEQRGWPFAVLRLRSGESGNLTRPVAEAQQRAAGIDHWLDQVMQADDVRTRARKVAGFLLLIFVSLYLFIVRDGLFARVREDSRRCAVRSRRHRR